MNVLILGSGGREHALAWKLKQSARVDKVYCAPGNGGISSVAECVPIKLTEVDRLISFAQEFQIGLTVVGPDDALAAGIVDRFEAGGGRQGSSGEPFVPALVGRTRRLERHGNRLTSGQLSACCCDFGATILTDGCIHPEIAQQALKCIDTRR